jgi:hypothetical protein
LSKPLRSPLDRRREGVDAGDEPLTDVVDVVRQPAELQENLGAFVVGERHGVLLRSASVMAATERHAGERG